MLMRRSTWLSALALAACSKGPPSPDIAPTAAPTTATTPAPTSAPTPAPTTGEARRKACDALAADTTVVLDKLVKQIDELGLPAAARPDREAKGLGACVAHPGGKGAWILVVEQAEAMRELPARAFDPSADPKTVGLNAILNEAGPADSAIEAVLAGDPAGMKARLEAAMNGPAGPELIVGRGDAPAAPTPGDPPPAAPAPPEAAPEPEPITRAIGDGPYLAAGEASAPFAVRWVVAFVHVGEDGATHRWVPDALSGQTPFNVVHLANAPVSLAIAEVFDWDGDGAVDLAWRHTKGDVLPDVDRGLLRVAEGRARLWTPIGDAPIDDVRDADEDGRPDLLTVGPFSFRGEEPATLRQLHRSLPAGGFTTSDDAVLAWYKKVCGGARVELASAPRSDAMGDVIDHAACARLWGASAAEVTTQLAAAVKDKGGIWGMGGDDLPYLPEPPVTLR